MNCILPLLILFLQCFSIKTEAASRETATPLRTAELVHQFPNGTWVENIAVRQNGRLLVTFVNIPELWEVDPSTTPATVQRLHQFNGTRLALGIAEFEPDRFTVATDNQIYVVDMNLDPPAITFLTRIQDTTLNGMTWLPPPTSRILSSDTSGGVIWAIDPHTGIFNITLWDETMFPVAGVRRSLVGINGIRYERQSGYLYYVNLSKLLFCRVRVDAATARAAGPYEVLREGVMADDFALAQDGRGTAYLAGLDRNVVYRATPDGRVEVVAGSQGSAELAGATSAAFGRTSADSGTLYVTTGGATAAPVNGTYTEGGKIMAIRGLL